MWFHLGNRLSSTRPAPTFVYGVLTYRGDDAPVEDVSSIAAVSRLACNYPIG